MSVGATAQDERRAVTRVERLKRELLQQVVEENLDLIHNRRRRVSRRSVGRGRLLGAGLLTTSIAALIFASAYAFSTAGGSSLQARSLSGRGLSPASHGDTEAALVPMLEPISPAVSVPSSRALTAPPEVPSEPVRMTPIDVSALPLAVRRVVIDAGHGGVNLGTHIDGLSEKELTLDIADRLAEILRDAGFDVLMTRDDDRFITLSDRAHYANTSSADIFISIHINWIAGGNTRGVETYYLGTTDDPELNRLAASENLDSGYSKADMRDLLDRIYSGARIAESQRLAKAVQHSLFGSLSRLSPQLVDRGVKTAPFLVLVETEMPAILAEVSCLSNEREQELLKKPLYRQYIAVALAQGIVGYAASSAMHG